MMASVEDAAFFRKIFLFQDLEDRELEQVLSRTYPREFPAGRVIIQEGDPGDSLYIMVSGEVEITKQLTLVLDKDTPKERVMIRLKAEDGVYFGEMSLLENDPRSATVTALSDCRLLELYQKDFLELVRNDPAMGLKLLLRLAQLLSRHLRKTNQDVVKLTTALAISLGG
jgi:CRP-like cAMP-binding protein